ncbi:cadherin-like protein 26, partial [Rhinichthys klamathensis goyatoka]|uniref:cadherin-like protein 26 n=1 Tax=Rhinichthys klamathensis goyatoka TaxID=3034132 RepID=UPI0024B4DA39
MKAVVIVFLVASVCIQCATASKQNKRAKRAWVMHSLSMEEEHSGPFPYKLGDLNIEKRVMEEYFIHGQGIDKDPKGILSVKSNGSVYALGKVDYEEYKRLTIRLTNENTSVAVDIVIQDVNDHAPVFNNEVYETTIDESTPQGEHLVTVLATDNDQFGSANSLFTLRIVSVSPQTSNTEFFIHQTEADVTGKISFKGCLDYEETNKYTILVEAKDHGEKVQLSSTSTVILNIIDKNNHLPEFTGATASSRVSGEPVCRVQVTDTDSRGSAAWRARYSLRGEEAQHFKIQTEPDTNDGVVTVSEPLNYEERSNLSLTVIVENEEPFFYCRVTGRPKHGLWYVQYSRGKSRFTSASLLITNIKKDDISEPSVFVEMVKHVDRLETGPILEVNKLGMCLSQKNIEITAVDPDLSVHFELMGDVEGEWRLHSNYGTTVRLIKESAVRAGDHELTLKISDSRGQVSLQSLSVRVCDCDSADCHVLRGLAVSQLSVSAVAAVILSLLLLLGMVLMVCQIRCSAKNYFCSFLSPD